MESVLLKVVLVATVLHLLLLVHRSLVPGAVVAVPTLHLQHKPLVELVEVVTLRLVGAIMELLEPLILVVVEVVVLKLQE
jgi:hypothetical protein